MHPRCKPHPQQLGTLWWGDRRLTCATPSSSGSDASYSSAQRILLARTASRPPWDVCLGNSTPGVRLTPPRPSSYSSLLTVCKSNVLLHGDLFVNCIYLTPEAVAGLVDVNRYACSSRHSLSPPRPPDQTLRVLTVNDSLSQYCRIHRRLHSISLYR